MAKLLTESVAFVVVIHFSELLTARGGRGDTRRHLDTANVSRTGRFADKRVNVIILSGDGGGGEGTTR